MTKKTPPSYQNNPFFIGYDGLLLFFRNARSVAIYTVAVTVASGLLWLILNVALQLTNEGHNRQTETPGPVWHTSASSPLEIAVSIAATIGIVAAFVFVIVVAWALLFGVCDYAAAQLATGKKTDLKTSFKVVLSRLPSYVWVYVVVIIKVALWSLLFIVPGIIMAVRYSLAGTVFFAEGKHGNAAVKRSAQLTKGAWLTTFAGVNLWNMITQGLMTAVLMPGILGILYSQLRDVTDSHEAKPSAHWLSWLTLLVPIAFIVLVIGSITLLAAVIVLMQTAP